MRRPLTVAFAALLLGACPEAPRSTPALLAVEPASGPNDVRVELEVRGDFEPATRVDFEGGSTSTLDGRFQARLFSGNAGEGIDLEEVALVGKGTLRAVVPAGAPERRYTLQVLDPRGRSGTLEKAYRALSPANSVARLLVAPISAQLVGVPFTVTASAIDSTGRVVEGFEAEARLSDATGTLAAQAPPRFSGGRLTASVSVDAPADSNVLLVEDSEGRSAASRTFATAPALPVALRVASAPPSVQAGACSEEFVLRLEDAGGRPPEVPVGATVQLRASLPELGFFVDAACRRPVGEATLSSAGVATFHALSSRSGTGLLRLAAEAVPAVEHPVAVGPGAASGLAFLTPSQRVRVGGCSQTVELASVGGDGLPAPVAGHLPLRLAAPADLLLFVDAACSIPSGSLSLEADAAVRTLYVSPRAEGLLVLAAQAQGLGVASEAFLAVP